MNDKYPPIHHRRHHLRHSPTRLGEKTLAVVVLWCIHLLLACKSTYSVRYI